MPNPLKLYTRQPLKILSLKQFLCLTGIPTEMPQEKETSAEEGAVMQFNEE